MDEWSGRRSVELRGLVQLALELHREVLVVLGEVTRQLLGDDEEVLWSELPIYQYEAVHTLNHSEHVVRFEFVVISDAVHQSWVEHLVTLSLSSSEHSTTDVDL